MSSSLLPDSSCGSRPLSPVGDVPRASRSVAGTGTTPVATASTDPSSTSHATPNPAVYSDVLSQIDATQLSAAQPSSSLRPSRGRVSLQAPPTPVTAPARATASTAQAPQTGNRG